MSGASFLRIGGITMRVVSNDARAAWRWEEPIARFLIEPARAADELPVKLDVDLDVRIGLPEHPPSTLLFNSGAVWTLYRTAAGFRIDCQAEVFGETAYKVALFDDTFTKGVIHLREDVAHLNPLDYPLDEVLVAQLLARGRGVELHACGIIDGEGRGRLFVGVSGAGKSTTAQLWEGHARGIVSDDRVIVREIDGAMWMFGTPWHGEAARSLALGAPLAGVYLLTQADVNALQELSPAAAVARMFRCTFPPFHDAEAIAFTLKFLETLTAAVPVRELRFRRDAGAVAAVLE